MHIDYLREMWHFTSTTNIFQRSFFLFFCRHHRCRYCSPVRFIPVVGVTPGAHYRRLLIFFMFQNQYPLVIICCLPPVVNVAQRNPLGHLSAMSWRHRSNNYPNTSQYPPLVGPRRRIRCFERRLRRCFSIFLADCPIFSAISLAEIEGLFCINLSIFSELFIFSSVPFCPSTELFPLSSTPSCDCTCHSGEGEIKQDWIIF